MTRPSMTEDKLVELLIKVRSKLRERKLYDLSDNIRAELKDMGIMLLDYPGGKTLWRRITV